MFEKELMFNNSFIRNKMNTCAMTDLQSCYDCQLANVRGIIEETVGHDRSAMKLIAKVAPRWEHHVSIGCGISKWWQEQGKGIVFLVMCIKIHLT